VRLSQTQCGYHEASKGNHQQRSPVALKPRALSFSQNDLCRGSQFAGLVFDELPLDLKLQPIGLVFVFNNAIYNIEDFAANASY
jgi:hypothetical protein